MVRSNDQIRLETAHHEAGHAITAYTLRRPVALVSIRGTEHYRGVASHVRAAVDRELVERHLDEPSIAWPCRVRKAIEADICILMAGEIAEELAGFMPDAGYVRTAGEELSAEAMARLGGLSRKEAGLLTRLESATEPFRSDPERAAVLAHALSGDAAIQHLSYIRAEARVLVHSETFRRRIERLVPVLLERGALSGRAVREILREGGG